MTTEELQISDNRYTMKQLKKRYQRRGLYAAIPAFCVGALITNFMWNTITNPKSIESYKNILKGKKSEYVEIKPSQNYENKNSNWLCLWTLGNILAIGGATAMGLRNDKKINELEKELEIE